MPCTQWAFPADARSRQALLDVAGARAIDRAAIDAGTPEIDLMERAGAATASAILARWSPVRTLVMTGPGNNGGDGFVIARLLRDAGWDVTVAGLVDRARLAGAARMAADRWPGTVDKLCPECLAGNGLVVDALFGTGLARPLEGEVAQTVSALNTQRLPVVAVDIPSGIESDSGAILGEAVRADMTVTFFRRKPGHLLLPGRDLCGAVETADLAVPDRIYGSVPTSAFANEPGLWRDAFPWPGSGSHKYTRGHAVVLGGTVLTGAARLAAHAAQRIGAGLVTIAADPSVAGLYAAWRADLMVRPVASDDDFRTLLADRRRNAVLLGPGAGIDARLRAAIEAALDSGAGLVLDADCFAVLGDRANGLLSRLNANVLLTPHEGEFARVFGEPRPRLSAARSAARACGAAVVLKGSDTIIAGADGSAAINVGAPPDLATGGSGDVLAGLCVGLVANHLPPILAGLIACWIHGRAAKLFGPGLIAGDLPDLVPVVLRELRDMDRELLR
jgi:NAD(P)H-hydrate epimerase